MKEDASQGERFLDLVAQVQARDPDLSSIQAAMLVAAELGAASDTRSFARVFGIAHALVLREVSDLADRRNILRITRRDERTMRAFYEVVDVARSGRAALSDD